jgi:hypothetical protein
MKSSKVLAVSALVVSFAVFTIGHAQQSASPAATAQPSPAAAAETAGQSKNFTNIQVIKDIPADQVIPSMQFIKAALGVECVFCHVTDKGHPGFALDDKKNKKVAREMMLMTNAINQNPAADKRVTCATCHQGHNQPQNNPPVMDEARWQEGVDAKARQAQQQQQRAAATPSAGTTPPAGAPAASQAPQSGADRQKSQQAAADAIFAKYLQAVGGDAAVQKLKSLHEKGTVATPHGDFSSFDLQRQAPDKFIYALTPAKGDGLRLVYNGTDAAAIAGGHADKVTRFELGALKLDAIILRNVDLKPQYARAQALPFTQKIDGREMNVVRAQLPNNQGQETLYFDFLSGLLARRVVVLRTAMGGIPQQTDYSDYRDVSGVKIAFVAKVATADNIQTRTITEATLNAPIDERQFAIPAEPATSNK